MKTYSRKGLSTKRNVCIHLQNSVHGERENGIKENKKLYQCPNFVFIQSILVLKANVRSSSSCSSGSKSSSTGLEGIILVLETRFSSSCGSRSKSNSSCLGEIILFFIITSHTHTHTFDYHNRKYCFQQPSTSE